MAGRLCDVRFSLDVVSAQALSKLFHPHGDLAKIDPEAFQKVWEKLDDAKEAAEADVNMKVWE